MSTFSGVIDYKILSSAVMVVDITYADNGDLPSNTLLRQIVLIILVMHFVGHSW